MLHFKGITKKVSVVENNLIKVTRHLQFGTIYGVEVQQEDKTLITDLALEESDLIDYVREHPYIDVLTVHAGRPATAETDYMNDGFRCRKKHKFPTVKTEG